MVLARHNSAYARFGKRVLDLSIAVPALLCLGLPILMVAVAVRFCCGRPVFFTQARIGQFGDTFRIIKFRTMVAGARGGTVTRAGDARVTRLGRILREWKLDELPQLWNVIRGEMSVVGPRADVPGFADRLTGDDRLILSVLPGITGPATLAYRNEEAILALQGDAERYNSEVIFPDKVRINRVYVQQLSLLGDLRYIGKTVAQLFDHNPRGRTDGIQTPVKTFSS